MHETFWNTEVFPDEIFWYCVTKSFRRRNLIPPFLMHKIFRYSKFCDTPKCFPTNIFGTTRRKFFDGKYWYPPPFIHKLFRYQKFSETAQKGSPMKFFGTVRQKIFDGKSWYPPPLLSIIFFATGLFLKHGSEGFHYEIFRHCETKIFQQKLIIPFCIKYRNQWWNWCL